MIEFVRAAHAALLEFRLLKEQLDSAWKDPVSVRFQQNYLNPIERDLEEFVRSVESLSELLYRAEIEGRYK